MPNDRPNFAHLSPSFLLNTRRRTSAACCAVRPLVFNVEVNPCRGAVLGYLLAVQFHF